MTLSFLFFVLKKGKTSFTSIAGQAIGLLGIIDFKKAKGPVCLKTSYFFFNHPLEVNNQLSMRFQEEKETGVFSKYEEK